MDTKERLLVFYMQDLDDKFVDIVQEASKENLELGNQKYKNLKTFLKPYLHLPNTDKLRDLKNDLGFYLENASEYTQKNEHLLDFIFNILCT